MSPDARAAWEDEKRWDYAHTLLCLEAVAPLYDYVGIPFQGEAATPFQQLLRTYVREIYLERPAGVVVGLGDKQSRLLRAVDNAYNAEWRDEYISWLVHVFVYTVGEHTGGWSQWRTIIMRCSVRTGWWQRLSLPADRDSAIQRELSDTKTRADDARELARSLAQQPASDWDQRVMAKMGIDAEAIEAGAPFSGMILTANFFLFYLFWAKLMKLLSLADAERLWESAKAVAPDLKIRPGDVPHPGRLRIVP